MTEAITEKLTQSAEEMAYSLTGFDEIAITKAFGGDISEVPGTMKMRAMVFVQFRREGQSDADAYQSAMGLSLKETTDRFAEEPDDVMPDEPESAAGKDDSPPVMRLTS